MSTVTLADHPVVQTAYGRWQALNDPLGVTAFGINAIVCDPGEAIETEHDESDTGQQEVYVVLAGRVAFRHGPERLEGGPGTVFSAPDPAVTRSLEALEPGSRVVCIGGLPSTVETDYGTWITAKG
ncbi:MAG TPA: hypothetical protein VMU66_11195 [Gaiellales bacterium]|nr:hypothetical protein [Gaiellales bacterium]